ASPVGIHRSRDTCPLTPTPLRLQLPCQQRPERQRRTKLDYYSRSSMIKCDGFIGQGGAVRALQHWRWRMSRFAGALPRNIRKEIPYPNAAMEPYSSHSAVCIDQEGAFW